MGTHRIHSPPLAHCPLVLFFFARRNDPPFPHLSPLVWREMLWGGLVRRKDQVVGGWWCAIGIGLHHWTIGLHCWPIGLLTIGMGLLTIGMGRNFMSPLPPTSCILFLRRGPLHFSSLC